MNRCVQAVAFLGAFQDLRGGSWDEAVRAHTHNVFPSRARRAALVHLRDALESAPDFEVFELRAVGYSWGAWTALQIACIARDHPRRLHARLEHARIEIRLGLLDPVGTLRSRLRIPTGARIWNVYQRNGCYRGCPGRSAWYRGCAVPGAQVNLDISVEGRERPEEGQVPPAYAPDHIQVGYRGWGGYDQKIAAVLAHGQPLDLLGRKPA